MKSLMLLGRKMEEEKVKLGIGIGVESYVVGSGGGMFTARQLHELEQQAVIYKYLAARVPVPFHLVAPIWESVAVSLRPCKSVTPFNHLDYRDQMDPEPGRCRRTDGKKWRCGRNVIPQHKYCEQHMHRGRGRSRKPVENSEVASPTSAKKPKHSEGESWNSKTSIQISPPKSLLRTRKSSLTSLSQGASTAASGHHECNKSITSATTASIGHIPPARETATSRAALPTATVAGPTTGHNSHSTQFNLNIGPGDNISNHGAKNCMIRESSNTRNSMNIGSNASPGLGFSPRSVLQGSNGNKSGEELEPVRCRKTDGMKSQCKREVLPVEKYCSQHTARGVKREAKDFKPVAVPSTSAATVNSTRLSQTTPKSRKTERAVPSTNLSISIPASSSLIQNDENSDSGSDSDATITDTSLAAYDGGYVSS